MSKSLTWRRYSVQKEYRYVKKGQKVRWIDRQREVVDHKYYMNKLKRRQTKQRYISDNPK